MTAEPVIITPTEQILLSFEIERQLRFICIKGLRIVTSAIDKCQCPLEMRMKIFYRNNNGVPTDNQAN